MKNISLSQNNKKSLLFDHPKSSQASNFIPVPINSNCVNFQNLIFYPNINSNNFYDNHSYYSNFLNNVDYAKQNINFVANSESGQKIKSQSKFDNKVIADEIRTQINKSLSPNKEGMFYILNVVSMPYQSFYMQTLNDSVYNPSFETFQGTNPNLFQKNQAPSANKDESLINSFSNFGLHSNSQNSIGNLLNFENKFICNYELQIENDENFRVTKRIIGNKGLYLKSILLDCCGKYGDYSTKIRLRGRGSGFKEGPNHTGKLLY